MPLVSFAPTNKWNAVHGSPFGEDARPHFVDTTRDSGWLYMIESPKHIAPKVAQPTDSATSP